MQPLQFVHNDDATAALAFVRPGQAKTDYRQWVDWIMETPVDTYAAHAASPFECFYPTAIGENYGRMADDSTDLQMRMAQIMDELRCEGTDPFRVQADRVHEHGKRFLAAIRLSDAHYQWPWCGRPPVFFTAHQEWRICKADGTTDWYMDYAVPEVRAHVFAIIAEIAERYPIDGLELDFMRFCRHFQRPATTAQLEIMTEFIRQIRSRLDRVAAARGRTDQLILGARVPATLADCAPNGLDPAAWAREGLVDYLNPCHWLFADYTIPLDDYSTAITGSACRLLYAIQPRAVATWGDLQTQLARAFAIGLSEFRALAATAYAAGADGLHTFNLCCELPQRREEMQAALHAMGSVSSIYAGLRHYQNVPADPDGSDAMSGTVRWQQLRFEPDAGRTTHSFLFQTGEGAQRVRGRLTWRIFGSLPADQWQFRLNGRLLDVGIVTGVHRRRMEPDTNEQSVCEYTATGAPIVHDHQCPEDAFLPDHMLFVVDLAAAPALSFRNTLDVTALDLVNDSPSARVMSVLEVWAESLA